MSNKSLYASSCVPSAISQKIFDAKRIVIKVGTNVLMGSSGILNKTPDIRLLETLAFQIIELQKKGKEIILVSSGSIGFGAAELEEKPPIVDIPIRQACAAIGQPLLMQAYKKVFQQYKSHCAQILLTGNDFSSRTSYLALRNCIELLLKKKVIPIVNENDSVSTDEIDVVFGDNDNLSAMLAAKVSADVLILLTDVDGLYDKNPKKYQDAKKILYVENIQNFVEKKETVDPIDGDSTHTGSVLGTGGINTKIQAAQIASNNNCMTIIALATQKEILYDIFDKKINGSIII